MIRWIAGGALAAVFFGAIFFYIGMRQTTIFQHHNGDLHWLTFLGIAMFVIGVLGGVAGASTALISMMARTKDVSNDE